MAPEESAKSDVAKREEEILAFWNENKIFEKSLKKQAPKGEFVFYDGPPFATGLPHYGHIVASTIKDVIPRYKTMRGYHVRRRWGWDCHGLPLENQIEKELNLATKRDIERLGISKFNQAARRAVLRYADDWKKIIPRIGRWVDMRDDSHQASEGGGRVPSDTPERAQAGGFAYRTMDADYTESVWWAFKNLFDKGLVYEGFKAMHLCPRCGTTLSNFEVAQGYKDVTDISVTVKLPIVGQENTFLLAWTTTPWTLPGNFAAAVNPEVNYVRIKIGDEKFVLAKERLSVIAGPYDIEKELLGRELVGLSYVPPFPYFQAYKMENKNRAWKVYGADFVTMTDGTGVVHIAPGFGADDLQLAQKEKIPIVHHVDKDGIFVDAVSDLKGVHAKPKDDPQSADIAVIKYLAAKNLLFAKAKITHSYPHCWRCDTPLLNYAASSWFVSVTKFSKKLVSENKRIRWIPSEVGQNRFGDWLEHARDWAISRARFWGAPIPVWRNPKTKALTIVGSLDDLKRHVKKSGNRYFIMRHGESEKNIQGIARSKLSEDDVHLTEKGKKDALASVQKISKKVDLIVTSPFIRTKETAEIAASVFKLPAASVLADVRLSEYAHGVFDRKPDQAFWSRYTTSREVFENGPEGGESVYEMRRRIGSLLYELEKKYQDKNILIISHGWPLAAAIANAHGASGEEAVSIFDDGEPEPAEIQELSFVPLPHNENYELDFHRPYIDELELVAKDGTRLERVHDVFDCWFESGSMSYAQDHYPFEKKHFDPTPGWFRSAKGYPADFIAEGLDQTRGWFYSLLVLGTALFGKAPYKNVIVNGIVLAEDGQKMSKRLSNYPDPLSVVATSGADALRFYLLSSPLMRAEDLNFSEKDVGEISSKLIGRLMNVLSFYELYREDVQEAQTDSTQVLDRWILARTSETLQRVEEGMETYALDRAARPLMEHVEDVSTWYLRRSRDRFKDGGKDAAHALKTTREVLRLFSIIAAPFVPFVAESVFQKVKSTSDPESVHLCTWPDTRHQKLDASVESDMQEARRICSLGLEARSAAGIKVRQPLQKLTINSLQLAGKEEFLTLIKDEVNVKEIAIEKEQKEAVVLATAVTDELRIEGEVRDFIRLVQDLRKQADLLPKDKAILTIAGDSAFVEAHWHHIQKTTNLISFEKGETTYVRKA